MYLTFTNTVGILTILFQSIDFIMPFLCNFWCQKSEFELKSHKLALLRLNLSDYTACIRYCHVKQECKAFEYDTNHNVCRFTANLQQNVKQGMGTNYALFWKKSTNYSCVEELSRGNMKRINKLFSECFALESHPNFLKSLGHRPRPWVILILSNGLGSNSQNHLTNFT